MGVVEGGNVELAIRVDCGDPLGGGLGGGDGGEDAVLDEGVDNVPVQFGVMDEEGGGIGHDRDLPM